jgi:hypothetical protein
VQCRSRKVRTHVLDLGSSKKVSMKKKKRELGEERRIYSREAANSLKMCLHCLNALPGGPFTPYIQGKHRLFALCAHLGNILLFKTRRRRYPLADNPPSQHPSWTRPRETAIEMAIKHNQQIPHNRKHSSFKSIVKGCITDLAQTSERIGSDEFEFTSTRYIQSII